MEIARGDRRRAPEPKRARALEQIFRGLRLRAAKTVPEAAEMFAGFEPIE